MYIHTHIYVHTWKLETENMELCNVLYICACLACTKCFYQSQVGKLIDILWFGKWQGEGPGKDRIRWEALFKSVHKSWTLSDPAFLVFTHHASSSGQLDPCSWINWDCSLEFVQWLNCDIPYDSHFCTMSLHHNETHLSMTPMDYSPFSLWLFFMNSNMSSGMQLPF
jgi:hypothetical protein